MQFSLIFYRKCQKGTAEEMQHFLSIQQHTYGTRISAIGVDVIPTMSPMDDTHMSKGHRTFNFGDHRLSVFV